MEYSIQQLSRLSGVTTRALRWYDRIGLLKPSRVADSGYRYRWLTIAGSAYDPAKHRGIAELYAADERFTAYYDKPVSGCARFLRDAICRWADVPGNARAKNKGGPGAFAPGLPFSMREGERCYSICSVSREPSGRRKRLSSGVSASGSVVVKR